MGQRLCGQMSVLMGSLLPLCVVILFSTHGPLRRLKCMAQGKVELTKECKKLNCIVIYFLYISLFIQVWNSEISYLINTKIHIDESNFD